MVCCEQVYFAKVWREYLTFQERQEGFL
jgi:hypothetical protein